MGAENMVLTLATEQINNGHAVKIAAIVNNPASKPVLLSKSELSGIPTISIYSRSIINIRAIITLRGLLKRNQIDIIHSHGYKADFFSFAATVFMNKPKKIATCHTWYSVSFKLLVYEIIDKIVLFGFSRIVVVSHGLMADLCKIGISKKKICLINNSIDIEKFFLGKKTFDIRKEYGLAPDSFILAAIGRLAVDKGHIFLMYGVKALIEEGIDVRCFIIGNGPQFAALRAKIIELKLEHHIILTGSLGNIAEILDSIDVFVMPSLKEGMPIALLEAMASRKAIVASGVGMISSLIIPDRNGLLVKQKDPIALKEAIKRYYENPSLRLEHGNNAQTTLVEQCSSKKMAREYLTEYSKCLV